MNPTHVIQNILKEDKYASDAKEIVNFVKKGLLADYEPGRRGHKTADEVEPRSINTFSQICDPGIKLNLQLPWVHQIGTDRLREYFECFFKTGTLNDLFCTEGTGDVKLTTIDPLKSEEERLLKKVEI